MNSQAYFATGCFWGAEANLLKIDGVVETSVGYMGGLLPHPTYEQVCTGESAHAETVKLLFDTSIVTFQTLLETFWTMHDPTSFDVQGGDIGSQYRSVIFASTDEQFEIAHDSKQIYQRALTDAGLDEICTRILKAKDFEFYLAEEYHQKYILKNPNGYVCHSSTGVLFPKEF